jgi:SAM-dependent methyltransferase
MIDPGWNPTKTTAALLRRLPRGLKRVLFRGTARCCPMCGSAVRRFLSYGVVRRPEAMCPVCGAMERHRLAWLFLAQHTDLLDGRPKRLLHFAPEEEFEARFRAAPAVQYLSADLVSPRAMAQADITALQFADAAFDMLFCSHVLEHVSDDRKAMTELWRVLAPGGWALFQVPVTAERTVEDPTVADPAERQRRFGQWDHVRRYGPDFADRLAAAGFTVQVVTAADLLDAAGQRRLGIPAALAIFYCRKARAEGA